MLQCVYSLSPLLIRGLAKLALVNTELCLGWREGGVSTGYLEGTRIEVLPGPSRSQSKVKLEIRCTKRLDRWKLKRCSYRSLGIFFYERCRIAKRCHLQVLIEFCAVL